jgi:PRTRC genetic system protein C
MTVREFWYTNKEGQRVDLDDYDPDASPEDVRKTYAPMYPDLRNARVVYHEADQSLTNIEFKPAGQPAAAAAGTKGSPSIEFKPSVGKKA